MVLAEILAVVGFLWLLIGTLHRAHGTPGEVA